MIIQSAKIENFKSIGCDNNILHLEDTVTALIGKNESGKSNVLESLGLLNLWMPIDTNYLNKLTRGQNIQPAVSLFLKFSKKEKDVYSTTDEVTILRHSGTEVAMEGGLSSLIANDEKLSSHITTLTAAVEQNYFVLDNTRIKNLRTHVAKLSTISQKIYANIFGDLYSAKSHINASNVEDKLNYLEIVDEIITTIKKYYNLIPQVYYRKTDSTLKDSYTYDEIKKIYEENTNPAVSNNVFFNMMNAAGIDKSTLIGAFEGPTDPAKFTYEKIIARKINALVEAFNKFYNQERIKIEFNISGRVAKFYITTADMYMSFSERSNGLKWYFNLFVDVKSKTCFERPILYLLDEPGVFLHVKAQKQLLELFAHLCEDGNQVVYTTHSPFMINTANVFNVRAVEKDKNGYSNIYRSIYNHKLSKESKLETLSPLIEAFGMNISDNIGPQYGKVNVVVEGITDCMYLTAMMHVLGIEEDQKPNIVPCAGVDNVNLVVSILFGWGCQYKVVVDYDAQGYSQYKKLTHKSGLMESSNICFVNCKTANNEQDVKGTNKATTEFLIAEEDNDKLVNRFDGTNDTKTLAAKEFMDKVLNKEIEVSQTTIENFKKLFVCLGIIN